MRGDIKVGASSSREIEKQHLENDYQTSFVSLGMKSNFSGSEGLSNKQFITIVPEWNLILSNQTFLVGLLGESVFGCSFGGWKMIIAD